MEAREAAALRARRRRPGQRLRSFFVERVWSVPLRELTWGRALLYRLARIAYATVRGFIEHRLTVRAAALTYYSALSIVPFLAFAFAVLKGLGAYSAFVENTLRPYIHGTFDGNQALVEAAEQILRFVDRTNVSTLGTVGLLVLVYASVSLLSSIEDALNEAWGVVTKRSLVRQLTNYVTLLVTAPLLILVAATLATAVHSSAIVQFLRQTLALGSVIEFLLRFTSIAVVWMALFSLFMILPNARVSFSSALFGAAVGAILWQGALLLYVQFQMGVAGYSALYSALGAVPIFLVFTYVSWVVVLIGAQVAASHQGHRALRGRIEGARADVALREDVAVLVAARVARHFLSDGDHPTETALAAALGVPEPIVQEVLDVLVRRRVLERTAAGKQAGYVPSRDPGTIHLRDVQDAIRYDERAEELREHLHRRSPAPIDRLLRDAEEETRRSEHNVSLRDLAALLAEDHAPDRLAPPGGERPLH